MAVTIPTRFQDMTLYQVLNVEPTATTAELKTAYRKAAIKVHPDHNQSPDAGSEFAYLSQVHQTLADSDKRKTYDETGDINEAMSDSPSADADFDEQYAYYRTMFPPITLEDIELHKQRYIGSDEEVEDLRHAYEQTDGKLADLMTYALHATADDVQRIADIITSKIDPKRKYTAKQIKAVTRQMSEEAENEAAEVEEHIQNLPKHQRLALQAVQSNGKGKQMTDEQQLTALIQATQKNSKNNREKMFNAMLDKYSAMEKGKGGKKGGKQQKHAEPDIDDAEFERIQQEIDARRAGNKSAASSSSAKQPVSGEKRKRKGR